MQKPDIHRLYTTRHHAYATMIKLVGHEAMLTKYFQRIAFPDDVRVLDAGCGAGALTKSVCTVLDEQKIQAECIHGFDFSAPAVQDYATFAAQHPEHHIAVTQCDARVIDSGLSLHWKNYDYILSSGMLEYLDKTALAPTLKQLASRLHVHGKIIVFISRNTWLNKLFLEKIWQANTYTETELRAVFQTAGLKIQQLRPFRTWGYVIEATQSFKQID
ncbi:MAG: hypothetical protein QG626_620 [Patescibacteria group bacterium]|jgi:cyclopropane fatty-acyl-phospholipid synthase-like methyltransferase|nr:hypothetical protein [Patescibacteria group bacterium]